MSSYQPRRPAGVPTGGQFASKSQPAPGYTPTPTTVPARRPSTGDRSMVAEVHGDGSWIERYCRDGRRHDPDDGSPAVAYYYPDGTVEHERHYRDGRYHDPDDGCPTATVGGVSRAGWGAPSRRTRVRSYNGARTETMCR